MAETLLVSLKGLVAADASFAAFLVADDLRNGPGTAPLEEWLTIALGGGGREWRSVRGDTRARPPVGPHHSDAAQASLTCIAQWSEGRHSAVVGVRPSNDPDLLERCGPTVPTIWAALAEDLALSSHQTGRLEAEEPGSGNVWRVYTAIALEHSQDDAPPLRILASWAGLWEPPDLGHLRPSGM